MELGQNRLSDQGVAGRLAALSAAGISISVREPPQQTAKFNGLSGPELERIDAAFLVLRMQSRKLAWVVLGDGLFNRPEREAREISRQFQNHLIQALKRAGKPPLVLQVVEADRGYHANFVCPSYAGINRLRASRVYGFALARQDAIQEVPDWQGVRSYLAGERTTQADWVHGHALGPRLKGSHQLETRQSGDRVRVSEALQAEMQRGGVWTPYKRSYAKPNPLPAPVAPAQPLETVQEASGQLTFIIGPEDNRIAAAEARRRALGIRQEDLAAMTGLSRPTIANVLARRYRPSSWAMARAAEFLREAA